MRLTSAVTPNSHSIHNHYTNTLNPNNYGNVVLTGTGGGLMGTINSNANNVVWDPNTNLPSSMLIAIKELQEQIDNLKNNNANNK
jgi:predicted Rossmann-fold nucleotide-binding protein